MGKFRNISSRWFF